MALTTPQLEDLLAQAQGGDWSVSDQELGIAAATDLFDAYLPGKTLTVHGATADRAARTVTGTIYLPPSGTGLAVVVSFTVDSNTVTGIAIDAELPGWQTAAPYPDLDLSFLPVLGFKQLHLLLQA